MREHKKIFKLKLAALRVFQTCIIVGEKQLVRIVGSWDKLPIEGVGLARAGLQQLRAEALQ
jgi:hypothetical protein